MVKARCLESLDYCVDRNKQSPLVVEKLVNDPEIIARLKKDPAFFSALVLGIKTTEYQSKMMTDRSHWLTGRVARQGGKTTGFGAELLWFSSMFPKVVILVISPSFRQSLLLRDKIEPLIRSIPKNFREHLFDNIKRTYIHCRKGGMIYFLPNSPDLIRGYTADAIYVDEVAAFKDAEYLFENVLIPMTGRTRLKGYGFIRAFSTPKGKGSYFYEICRGPKAVKWSQHHYTWREVVKAGLVGQSFIDELRATLSPQKFTMEYEAEFVEEIDSWIPYDMIIQCIQGDETRDYDYLDFNKPEVGLFYGGVDLGKHQDNSVIVAVRKEEEGFLNLVHKKVFPLETAYASVIAYMKVLSDRWNRFPAWAVDQTGVGDYIVEDMTKMVRGVSGVNFSVPHKDEIATNLKEIMRKKELKIPYDPELIDQLNVEKFEIMPDGKIKFSHPDNTHDDSFWALGLACWAARKPNPNFTIVGGAR